jgi:hypothetical protein
MTPDSSPENPAQPDPPRKARLPSKATLSEEGHIEFDFNPKSKPGRFPIKTDPEMIHDLQSNPADEAAENRRVDSVNRLSFAEREKKFYRPEADTEKTSTHQTPMPTLSSSPTPSINDFRRNADRQRREQRSVNSLLSGVAYALIGGILLVGILAGFGGYVLWKQIENQSVTVAQLNAKIDEQVAQLKIEQDRFAKFATDQAAFDIEVKEKLARLSSVSERNAAAGREEKDARIKEITALVKRITKVEAKLENRRASMPAVE